MHEAHHWQTIWNKPPLWLDDYEPTKPVQEQEFEAIPFRVSLLSNNLPTFHLGQVVSYRRRSSSESEPRYMVESCQLIQNGVAYLRILCRDIHQNVFPPYHPDLPAFMLLIPASFCLVDYPEILQDYEDRLNTRLQDGVFAGGCC